MEVDVSGLFIVPDSLRNAINAKLDAALTDVPDAAKDRDHLYHELLYFFNENGYLPEFSIGKKDASE
jgi:hypothetical protein